MTLPPHLTIKDGHLRIGGLDTTGLAERFGTPLYITDIDRITANYLGWQEALTSRYKSSRVLFAAKANGNPYVLRTLAGLGAGADVFSAGELELALAAGIPSGKLLFNGSSKSPGDLALAVEKKVKVSVDSMDELHQLDACAGETGETAEIAFRVNPALEVPTHPKIATGLASSKFGISHDQIAGSYKEALSCEHIRPVGVHCHIGSQILSVEPFARAAEVMMKVSAELTELGVRLEFVDIGGGLGIPYRHGHEVAPTFAQYADAVVPVFLKGLTAAGIRPELWVEPGRSVVGDSTILVTRVNSVKRAHRNFANVDAGFNLLIRPVMYDSYHEVVAADRADGHPDRPYTIAGPICET
ncbi:MAG: diaminopimelate decarboxylase, partial [Methanoregulaceae archaeon]|nr:diaminopimelate decarboxylase [Methanoregulaceae archaeon]